MNSSNHQMSLPVKLCTEFKGCALFEVSGTVYPYTDKSLFLCADFISSSTVGDKMLPVLRKIKLKPDDSDIEGIIDDVLHKLMWLRIDRCPLKEIRLYIVDDMGNIHSFDYCNLSCTLVCDCL